MALKQYSVGLLACGIGMVSCAVMGLLTLLRPLAWVAPLVPILPLKHKELLESPVPILAGPLHSSVLVNLRVFIVCERAILTINEYLLENG